MFARTNICIQTYNGTENVPLDWREGARRIQCNYLGRQFGQKSSYYTDSVLNK